MKRVDIEKAKSSFSYFVKNCTDIKLTSIQRDIIHFMEKEDVHPEIYRGRKCRQIVFVKNK